MTPGEKRKSKQKKSTNYVAKEAANHAFDKPKARGKRDNYDPRLRALRNFRRLAIEGHDSQTTKQLIRQIKKLTRTIKLDRFPAGPKDNMWDPVKLQRNGYTPKHTKPKKQTGTTST